MLLLQRTVPHSVPYSLAPQHPGVMRKLTRAKSSGARLSSATCRVAHLAGAVGELEAVSAE
jgi:hypothetical protein